MDIGRQVVHKEKRDVIVLTYSGLYSLPLVEAMLQNPRINVVKILNSTSIYGNKIGLGGMVLVWNKSTILFVIPKLVEKLMATCYALFLPIQKRPFKTLNELSKHYNVEVEHIIDVNSFDHSPYKGGTLFACYFNQVVSKSVLKLYAEAYNTHPAPLPEGRGMFSQFWLLKAIPFPKKYYQSVQIMSAKVDSGDVVVQRSIAATPVSPSMADYMIKVTILGMQIIKNFDFEMHPDSVFNSGVSTYYTFPKTMDVIDFWKKGCCFFRLVDVKNYLKMPKASEL